MKFIHTGDLHIGKFVNEFSMLKDQEYILKQIEEIVKEEKAEGLIIAGDVYDRSIPPAEAVAVLDGFLSDLIKKGIQVFLISGNHDSPERVGFASSILEDQGLHIAGTFEGELKKVTVEDQYGPLNIYLLPFMKSAVVKYYFPESKIENYEDSVRTILEQCAINTEERNVLVTHHFVTSGGKSPELSDSENMISVGGVDNVDASVFKDFDYVALGHIHRAQEIGGRHIRYSGSPIKYSFSEVFHKKSVCVVEITDKGQVDIRLRDLIPLHDMRKIKGNMQDLMSEEVTKEGDTNDYIQATLTDTKEIIDPIGTLRSVYPNTMQIITLKNTRTEEDMESGSGEIKKKSTMEIFEEFFCAVTDREFDESRKNVMREIIEEVGGGELE